MSGQSYKCKMCLDKGTISSKNIYSYSIFDDIRFEYCLYCDLGKRLKFENLQKQEQEADRIRREIAQEKDWRRRVWKAVLDLMKPLEPDFFTKGDFPLHHAIKKNELQLLHNKIGTIEKWAQLKCFEMSDFSSLNEKGVYYTDQEKHKPYPHLRKEQLAFIQEYAPWGVETYLEYWNALDNFPPIYSIWDTHCYLFNYVFNELPAYANGDFILEANCNQLKALVKKWEESEKK